MTVSLLCGPMKVSSDPGISQASQKIVRSSSLARWGKFNLVGAIGLGVQLATFFLFKSPLHWNYLLATGLAVEVAVLHNFIWHEHFTWADRIAPLTNKEQVHSRQKLNVFRPRPGFLRRLWRFHVANGAVSILGNLAMMRLLVGWGHMNYLVANMIAITVCALANFTLSDQWVFQS
jgi:putative flippase GtrA